MMQIDVKLILVTGLITTTILLPSRAVKVLESQTNWPWCHSNPSVETGCDNLICTNMHKEDSDVIQQVLFFF